jgi:hypothetical protein
MEVRAEPVRANADFGFRADVAPPRVEARSEYDLSVSPVRVNANINTPKA